LCFHWIVRNRSICVLFVSYRGKVREKVF